MFSEIGSECHEVDEIIPAGYTVVEFMGNDILIKKEEYEEYRDLGEFEYEAAMCAYIQRVA